MAEANNPSHKAEREGFLSKRQRGKKVVSESKRKKLKFEERYCILTSSEFTYKKKEKAAVKGTLLAGNIKVVEQVGAGTFSRQKCDFCFQVGDQNDMIYLVAKNEQEMKMWMNDFRKVAKQNQNVMSEFYHPGAYGSMRKEKWSCCGRAGVTADGCESCNSGNTQDEIDSLAKSFNLTYTSKSDMKPEMSHSFPRQGKKHSVTTISSFMTTSGESDYNGDSSDYTSGDELPNDRIPQRETTPEVIIESPADEISSRSRTSTQISESGADTGIDTDHGSRLNSNASCHSVLSRSRPFSEFDRDEGIDIQYDNNYSGHNNAQIPRTQSGKSIPLASVSHIAVKKTVSLRASTGSTVLDAVEEEDTGANMNMCESYVMSQPISAVALIDSEKKIVTGTVDGMVRIWVASLENQNMDKWKPMLNLTKSLRVAGEVSSVDVYKNYLLVGSTLAQVIDLSNPELPRKAFIADQKHLFSASKKKNLVAFARRGEEVMVVSGTIGGDKINVWKLPSWEDEMPFVLKPDLSLNIDGPIVSISCTTSTPNNDWVGVVSVEHNRDKTSVSLHLLNLQTANKHDVTFEEQISDKVYVTFLHSGRKIAVGSGRKLQVWETDTRFHLQSLTLRDTITSMHYSEGPDMSSGYLAVGLENGDVDIIVRKRKYYTQLVTFSHEKTPELVAHTVPMPAVALSFDEKFTWGVVVHPNGSLEVWQAAQENEALPRVTNHPTLGMELENEGLISQLETLHYSPDSGQGITSSGSQMQMEDHIETEIPQEVCENDGIFAVEAGAVTTSPLGPFVFPEELSSSAHIVSPIVWLCSVPQRRFSKQVKLKIPHCVRTDSDTKGHSGLRLLKADHTNVRLNKLGQRVIVFEDVTSKYAGRLTFNCDTLSVTAKDDHFCLYCLEEITYSWSDGLKSIKFCLTVLVPKRTDNNESYNIYCILHYDLDTCKRLIREQLKDEEYRQLNPETFSFGGANDSAVLSVEADVQAAELLGWQIIFDTPQEIEAKRVNYLTFDAYKDDTRKLCNDCLVEKTYPPRFVIRVAPQGAWSNSQFTLTFKGADREIRKEIELVLARDRIPDPSRPDDDEKRHDFHHFVSQANGFWHRDNN